MENQDYLKLNLYYIYDIFIYIPTELGIHLLYTT